MRLHRTRLHQPVSALVLTLGLATAVATLTQCTDQAKANNRGAQDPAGPAPAGQATGGQDPANAMPDPSIDRVRLLVSGSMQGRLEPCGCASGQSGGLPRRMQHIGEQRNYDILLEGGNLLEGNNALDVMKGFTAILVLFQGQHAYDALGVSKRDLALPANPWLDYLAMAPTVASDLESTLENWPGVPFIEKAVRNHRVRIASFTLELPAAKDGETLPFRIVPPTEAWQKAMADAAPETLRVLMFHGTDTQARATIPTLDPKPDLVTCFDESYSEPAAQPEMVDGVPLVFTGTRGRVVLDLTLVRGENGPSLGYHHVQLPASKTIAGGGGDPDVKEQLRGHRFEVAESGVLQALANQTPTANGAKYIGSQLCGTCHQTAFQAWKETPHAHAWKTLVDAEADPKRYGWPVTKYPDCVSCHVVGYGEVSGFVDAKTTSHLYDVGCERCHGAGSNHITNPAGNPMGLIGGVPSSQLCVQCHDFEQSPDFLYGERWPKIEHGREPHMPPKKK